jgi:hypothetical protein
MSALQYPVSRRVALMALGIAAVPAALAQVRDLNDAINKAGRQRMLSQRMVKAWLALGQQLQDTRAGKVLGDSMALFERQLAELRAFAPTEAIRTTYEQLDVLWGTLKSALVGGPPTLAAAPGLLAMDGKVLALAHQGTQQLEQHGGKPVGHLVNIAGRQRMLSQRMAKFQLAMAWKVPQADAAQQIDTARAEFMVALDKLAAAPETTAVIQEQIVMARQQWVFFDAALVSGQSPDSRNARNVFVASENILQVMDRITGLYARAAG